MFLGVERGTADPAEIKIFYDDAYLRVKKLFQLEEVQAGPYEEDRSIKLEDGYEIHASYRAPAYLRIRVEKWGEGALTFVMRESGLENVESMTPALELGRREVQLRPFAVGREGGMTSLQHPPEENDNMDIIGIQLVEWLEKSVKEGKLSPLDLSIKFPLLPSN